MEDIKSSRCGFSRSQQGRDRSLKQQQRQEPASLTQNTCFANRSSSFLFPGCRKSHVFHMSRSKRTSAWMRRSDGSPTAVQLRPLFLKKNKKRFFNKTLIWQNCTKSSVYARKSCLITCASCHAEGTLRHSQVWGGDHEGGRWAAASSGDRAMRFERVLHFTCLSFVVPL